MYFWKIEGLKDDIKNDRLSEQERFSYCVIYVTLCASGMEAMMHLPMEENLNIWDTTSSIGNILIVLVGTIFAYKANGGANGTDFLGRYFGIGFVVSIRLLVLLAPMFIALVFYYALAFPEEEEIVSSPLDTLLSLLWYVLIFWRICKHVNDVKN